MGVTLRVLLVEDSSDDAALIVRHLQRGGYDVVWERVESRGGMCSALEGRDWHIVISDHSMPHFSGTDALKLLRDQGPTCRSSLFPEPWAKTQQSPPSRAERRTT